LEDDSKKFIHHDILRQISADSKNHGTKQVLIKLTRSMAASTPSCVGPDNIRRAVRVLANMELSICFQLHYSGVLGGFRCLTGRSMSFVEGDDRTNVGRAGGLGAVQNGKYLSFRLFFRDSPSESVGSNPLLPIFGSSKRISSQSPHHFFLTF
jgi:hypothetical protein